jgi:hypothetical protein
VSLLPDPHTDAQDALTREFLQARPFAPEREVRALLQHYAALNAERPRAASPQHWDGVKAGWRNFFLAEGARAHLADMPKQSLHRLKSGIQIDPRQAEGYLMYGHVLQQLNARAMADFRGRHSHSLLLVAHVSCLDRLALASASASSFVDPADNVSNVTIVGDTHLGEYEFAFEPASGLLRVPCADDYESLPQKIRLALLFLGSVGLDATVLKVDDDIHCANMERLKQDLAARVSLSPYGGVLFTPGKPLFACTFWHMGKCSDPLLGETPDGMLNVSPYAAGPVYWLTRAAVNTLYKAAIINERFFSAEIYEDRAVGTLLAYYGIRALDFDLVRSGALEFALS